MSQETQPTIEQLLEENKALNSGIAQQESVIEALNKVVADLEAEITELKASAVAPKSKGATVHATFKVGKLQYGIIYPKLHIGNKTLTAEQVASNTEHCKMLVEEKSSAIKAL